MVFLPFSHFNTLRLNFSSGSGSTPKTPHSFLAESAGERSGQENALEGVKNMSFQQGIHVYPEKFADI
jgi:hypothetical protein